MVKIIAKKHDGTFHRSWESNFILSQTANELIGINEKAKVTESDGKTWRTEEPALFYLMKDTWFNIVHINDSNRPYYYCNLSSPFVLENNTVEYIDYEIDVYAYHDGTYRVVDKEEFSINKAKYAYDKELTAKLEDAFSNLLNMIKSQTGIFDKTKLDNYYNQFRNIEK